MYVCIHKMFCTIVLGIYNSTNIVKLCTLGYIYIYHFVQIHKNWLIKKSTKLWPLMFVLFRINSLNFLESIFLSFILLRGIISLFFILLRSQNDTLNILTILWFFRQSFYSPLWIQEEFMYVCIHKMFSTILLGIYNSANIVGFCILG